MTPGHIELFAGFLVTVTVQTIGLIWYLSPFTFKVTLMWNEFKIEKGINDNGKAVL